MSFSNFGQLKNFGKLKKKLIDFAKAAGIPKGQYDIYFEHANMYLQLPMGRLRFTSTVDWDSYYFTDNEGNGEEISLLDMEEGNFLETKYTKYMEKI